MFAVDLLCISGIELPHESFGTLKVIRGLEEKRKGPEEAEKARKHGAGGL